MDSKILLQFDLLITFANFADILELKFYTLSNYLLIQLILHPFVTLDCNFHFT